MVLAGSEAEKLSNIQEHFNSGKTQKIYTNQKQSQVRNQSESKKDIGSNA